MKNNHVSFIRRALGDQRGQVLPWTAFMIMSFLGMGGLVLDVGRAYVAHSQLQNSANAAALAAAGQVYNTSSTTGSTATANSYSASSGNANAGNGTGSVTTNVWTKCLNVLMPSGTTCGSSSAKNAVQVTQTETLKTVFMPIIFGPKSLTVVANATASMQGAAKPYNVAIILDATQSMSNAPSSGSCSGYSTEFSCALAGVQDLLQAVNPCSGVTTCDASSAKVRISLFSFPNVSTTNVASDYTCSGSPTNEQYTLPLTNITSYTNLKYGSTTSTYQDVAFSYDWYKAGASKNLNSASNLVKAVGGCMKNPGGESTYYASVIYAAQAALAAEQAAYPNSQNAIIMLSDGQAQADNTKFPATGTAASPTSAGYSVVTNSTTNTKNLVGGAWGTYPDFNNECQQAITAAQTAQTAGTIVYSVAFGSESSGCTTASGGTDKTLTATATSGNAALSASTVSPCIVMKNIASPTSSGTSYFYADTSSSTSGCTDTAHTVQSIQDIFSAIASTFTTPRLLPNNAS